MHRLGNRGRAEDSDPRARSNSERPQENRNPASNFSTASTAPSRLDVTGGAADIFTPEPASRQRHPNFSLRCSSRAAAIRLALQAQADRTPPEDVADAIDPASCCLGGDDLEALGDLLRPETGIEIDDDDPRDQRVPEGRRPASPPCATPESPQQGPPPPRADRGQRRSPVSRVCDDNWLPVRARQVPTARRYLAVMLSVVFSLDDPSGPRNPRVQANFSLRCSSRAAAIRLALQAQADRTPPEDVADAIDPASCCLGGDDLEALGDLLRPETGIEIDDDDPRDQRIQEGRHRITAMRDTGESAAQVLLRPELIEASGDPR